MVFYRTYPLNVARELNKLKSKVRFSYELKKIREITRLNYAEFAELLGYSTLGYKKAEEKNLIPDSVRKALKRVNFETLKQEDDPYRSMGGRSHVSYEQGPTKVKPIKRCSGCRFGKIGADGNGVFHREPKNSPRRRLVKVGKFTRFTPIKLGPEPSWNRFFKHLERKHRLTLKKVAEKLHIDEKTLRIYINQPHAMGPAFFNRLRRMLGMKPVNKKRYERY